MKLLILLILFASCSSKKEGVIELENIKGNLSEIVYDKVNQEYLALINNEKYLLIYNKDFSKYRAVEIKHANNYDFEAITILKSENGWTKIVLANEKGKVYLADLSLSSTEINLKEWFDYKVFKKNKGVEGLAYNSEEDILYLCREKFPMEIKRYSISQNKFLKNYKVDDIESHISDISSCFYREGYLFILSEESSKIIIVDKRGYIFKEVILGNLPQYEGLFVDDDRFILASEPNYIEIIKF